MKAQKNNTKENAGYMRRDFIKGLAGGVLSASFSPSWAWGQSLLQGSNEPTQLSKPGVTSLPKFFDCNKYIGPGFPERPDFYGLPALLSHMDRLGISRSVSWHNDARDIDPMPGNERLLMEIGAACVQNRVTPSFIITPSIIENPESKERFLELVKTNNIRAFHFFMKGGGWKLTDISPVIRDILPFMPVLFLDSFENLGNVEDILNFSGEFPQVPLVFINAIWVHLKNLYELMGARSNIYVDTSLMHTYRTIEFITRYFGVERLIFGAGYKSNNGASIASLAWSGSTPEDARSIAHGNLERLLGVEEPLSGEGPVVGDRFWHRLLRGEHLGVEVLDAHTHHFHYIEEWEDYGEEADMDGFVRHDFRYMDGMGVSSMFVAEYELYPPDLETGKARMEGYLDKYGNRFRGYFCGLAAKEMGKEVFFKRCDELFSRPYYAGFKMHNSRWKIPVTDPCFAPIWEYANLHRLPILLHTWTKGFDSSQDLEGIVGRYPNAIFILGHSDNLYRREAANLAQANPNVYLEWCGSFLNPEDWREALEQVGNERLLYGTDALSWEDRWGHDPAWEMGRLLSLDVPDEVLIPVLGGNMKSILANRQ